MSDSEAILRWLMTLTVVSFAVAPLTWWLAEGLGNARHGLTRALGIVLVTAALWWPAALTGIPFNRGSVLTVMMLLGTVSWAFWWRGDRKMNLHALVVFEVIWLALFVGYALFRSYNPDIANTEKPMEIALLSSVSRSADVPAPDPWFAGETINYYYFGYQIIGTLVKLSGAPPVIAFNLALATLFASLGTAAAAAGYRIAAMTGVRASVACLAGFLATFFLLFAGNLESAKRLVSNPNETLETGWWYSDVGWQASRIIVDRGVHGSPDPVQTINEFPAFSFVLGDLHPHVLTYPLLLGIVALTAGIAYLPATATPARVAAMGSLIGLLYVSNSWDAPLGVLLLAGALVVSLGWRNRQTWMRIGIAGIAALLTAVPFLLHFTPPVGIQTNEPPPVIGSIPILSTLAETLGIVTWKPSSTVELLTVHGHWLVVFAMFAFVAIRTSSQSRAAAIRNRSELVLVGLPGALALAVLWVPGLFLLGLPVALAIAIVVYDTRPAVRTIAGLFAAGFLLAFIPEFIYIQDIFANRMNTVFKLYFQAWLVFSIAAGAGLAVAVGTMTKRVMYPLAVIGVILIMAVSPYVPLSARDWTADFSNRRGLDGSDYLADLAPDEAAAIDWFNTHAEAGAFIVEGPGCSYGTVAGIPMNRMSAFSGLPTIVGWAGHEDQWRRGEATPIRPRVEYRQNVANRWLSGEAATGIDLPEPDFIVLGALEASGSDSCQSLVPHDAQSSVAALTNEGWQPVFTSQNVVILGKNQP